MFSGFIADAFGPINSLFFSFFAGVSTIYSTRLAPLLTPKLQGILQLAFWSNATTYGTIIAFGALYQLLGGWFFALLPYAAAQASFPLSRFSI